MRLQHAFFVAIGLLGSALAGCAGNSEFMREPTLSPVGSGLTSPTSSVVENVPPMPPAPRSNSQSMFTASAADLYSDQRITKVGDIITVVISINDKATFGNTTDRSQSAKVGWETDWNYSNGSSASSTPPTLTADVNSTSSTQGQGNIDRSEQIQVSVAAVVTEVLPNGNLVISGSQEVRVNYELRQLTVAGIVRPWDISRNNTISYDRIAEARVSYGGRGRLMDVQQPNWGQQVWDRFKPF
ncbi:MAG TPA: flagellar basal body L-ring protein FlgH [Roseiarcus sp.]|nr:flagellar basal body L-ring protein FlgH [Roseiarcus sp.]